MNAAVPYDFGDEFVHFLPAVKTPLYLIEHIIMIIDICLRYRNDIFMRYHGPVRRNKIRMIKTRDLLKCIQRFAYIHLIGDL